MKIINFFKQHKIQGIIYILLTIGAIKEIINGFNPLYVLISFGIMIYCVYSTFNNKFFVKKYIECPNCNNKLDLKQKICTCGYDLNQSKEEIQVKRSIKKNNVIMVVGFYILILPIAIIFILWFLVAILFICFGATMTELKKYLDITTILNFVSDPIAITIMVIGFIVLVIGIVKKIKENSKNSN